MSMYGMIPFLYGSKVVKNKHTVLEVWRALTFGEEEEWGDDQRETREVSRSIGNVLFLDLGVRTL